MLNLFPCDLPKKSLQLQGTVPNHKTSLKSLSTGFDPSCFFGVCIMSLQWRHQPHTRKGLSARRSVKRLWGSALTAGLVLAMQSGATAAEKLVMKLGPFQQTVHVADVEYYARTGRVPSHLFLLQPFLNDNIRNGLNARLNVSPSYGQQFASAILSSPSGKQLLELALPAMPGITSDLVHSGISLAIKQFDGLNAIEVIKSVPIETITIDLSQALSIISKINWNYWRTQSITTMLQDSLKVEAAPVNLDFDPIAPGPYAVNKTAMTKRDQKRGREIAVDLYTPDAPPADKPLVLLAPGYEANKRFLAYLAEHLASHGFTAVALQHPSVAMADGTISLDNLIPETEFVDRPRDISFLLDELAKLNQESRWQNQFNTERTTVIGHSLGGYTALTLAGAAIQLDQLREFCNNRDNLLERVPADWLHCNATRLPNQKTARLRDQRVVQVMALNPAIGRIFGDNGMRYVKTPALVFSSSEDVLAPAISQQFQPFTQLPDKPKYLFTAIGTTHLSVSDPTNTSGAIVENTLVTEKRGPEMAQLHQALRGVTLAFSQQLTPEAEKYAPVLTAAYIQPLSSEQIVLRFNRQLPEDLARLFDPTTALETAQFWINRIRRNS